MEPNVTVRQRKRGFSERLLVNAWERAEIPSRGILIPLYFGSLALCGAVLLAIVTSPRWLMRTWKQYLALLGPGWESTLAAVAWTALGIAAAFVLFSYVLSFVSFSRAASSMAGRMADPAYARVVELDVRNARFVAGRGDAGARPWVLVAVAPNRVLYHSAWSRGETHPPSPVDSFPPGKFPSAFRVVLHGWYRSILRVEALGPLMDASGTLTTRDVPALPDGGMTRSPQDRWAIFEGDLEHPASLKRIECDSIAAIEAALAPPPRTA